MSECKDDVSTASDPSDDVAGSVPSIRGWSPPIIADDYAGTARLATQADVDRFLIMERHARAVMTRAAELEKAVRQFKIAMGLPADALTTLGF